MVRALLLASVTALSLSACVSTPDQAALDIRPVMESPEAEPVDRPALHASAKTAYETEDFKTALTDYRKLVWDDKTDIDARIGVINSALALGQTDDAFRHFTEINTDAANDDQSARLLAAAVLIELASENETDSEVRLNAALEVNLDDHRLWNALGAWHDGQKNWLKSLDTYIIALDKSFTATGHAQSSIINNMGMSLMMQGRLDEALDKFDQALDLRPGAQLYDNNRRLVFLLKGDTKTAVKDVSESRAAKLFADAGALASAKNEPGRAEAYLKKALSLSPVYLAGAAETLAKLQTIDTLDDKAP